MEPYHKMQASDLVRLLFIRQRTILVKSQPAAIEKCLYSYPFTPPDTSPDWIKRCRHMNITMIHTIVFFSFSISSTITSAQRLALA